MKNKLKIILWLLVIAIPAYIFIFSSTPLSFKSIYFSEGTILGLRLPILAIPLIILWIYFTFFAIAKIIQEVYWEGKNVK